jgi:hypothetical protein
MSTKRSIAISAEAAAGGAPITAGEIPPTASPTVTHYQQLAAEVMTALDNIIAFLPQLEVRHFSTATFARTHVNVSIEFLATVISAVEQLPELQSLNKLDVAVGRDTLQLLEAFRTVSDKFAAVQKEVGFTMMSKKADLVVAALQIYDIAKGMARDSTNIALLSHVANMKRDLNRRGPTAPRKARVAVIAPPTVTSA